MVKPDTHAGWRAHRAAPTLICVIAYALAIAAAWYIISLSPEAHPVISVLYANITATLVIYGFTLIFANASIYDPYWSLAPPLALAWWIAQDPSGIIGWREIIVFALVTIWSLRLTWNCLYRWRDLNHEDFRYRDLREKFPRTFQLVNLAGIQIFPTLLVFGGCLALYPVTSSNAPLDVIDALAITVTVSAVALEAIADLQLQRYLKSDRSSGPVLTRGVWSRSQHPNYLGEIGFWWGLWLFGLSANPAWWWTIVGPLFMTALFAFISIPMMLTRKRMRHPDYDEYVRGIPALLPRFRNSPY